MVIALAGRRIDPADAQNPSFPPASVDAVRSRLRELFEAQKATALVSSAACGADLLALEVAGALGLRRRVILPFSTSRFRETSVVDRPGDWGPLYDRVIADATLRLDLEIVATNSDDDAAYAMVNLAILNEAAALSSTIATRPVAALVWDGVSRGEADLTQAFGAEAARRGFPVVEIKTL